MNEFYLSEPALICFDGEDANNGKLTPEQQHRLNGILAEDKRARRMQLAKAERQIAELAESNNLSEQERTHVEGSLEELRQQLRSEEENAAIDKKKLEENYNMERAALKKREVDAEAKYQESTIRNALFDAAIAEGAFNPEVLVTVLRERTTLNADGAAVVDFNVKDPETGKETVRQISAADAIRQMKSEPTKYGGLFKEFLTTSVPLGKNGKVDVTKLTTEQYMHLRRTNPRALGL